MKKAAAVFLILIVTALFTACSTVSLSFRLDEDNTVSVLYMVDFKELEDKQFQYLNQLKEYWEEQGFSASADNDEFAVKGEKNNKYDTATQAAASFADVVTSDNVIFYDVLFEYTPSFEYDLYSFSARISLKDIIRQSQAQDMPSDIISSLRENASQGKYTVSIKLPGTVISSNANSIEDNTCTWVLKYGEVTELSVNTKKTNTENFAYRASLENRISSNQMLLVVFIAAGAVSLLAVAAAIIIRRVKIKRASVVRVRRFR